MEPLNAGAGKLGSSGQKTFVLQPNGQFALLQAAEEGSKLVHDGHVDTVTVVALPSGVLTTLPHLHAPSIASGSVALDGSPPTAPLSSPTPPSSITAPSSSPATSSSQAISTPTFDISTSPTDPSITSRPPSLVSSIHIAYSSSATSSPESNLAGKLPTYAGVALGSLVAFASLCAFTSWCVRRRSKRRRRKNAAELPWAERKNGHRTSDRNAGSNLMSGSTRTPTDRDVGEPRRSDSYGVATDSLHGPYFTNGARAQAMVDGDTPHGRKPTLGRHLPSHLVSEGFSTLTETHHLDQMGGGDEVGTPREGVVVPRYLSLKGDALELPWTTKVSQASLPPPPPRSMAERLHRTGNPASESWDLDTPDVSGQPMPKGQERDPEGWAGSITSNLVNAFNAVAANIATFKTEGEEGAMFTLGPSRRGTMRKSIQHDGPSDIPVGRGTLDRHYNVNATHSSMESDMPWTLEEITDGTGIVHIRISPSKERAYSRSTSSHYSSDSPPPTIPLVASHHPQPAVLKNEVSRHYRPRLDREITRSSSQASSSHRTLVSSGRSDRTVSPTRPLNFHRDWKDSREAGQKDKLSPSRSSLVSRLSSTSSATSWSNSLSSLPANNKVAEALRARKRAQYPKS